MIEIVPNWHPIFVHFTVAMLTMSVMLFIAGYVLHQSKRQEQMLIVAHWNFWIGTVSAIATSIAGWFAFNSVTHDTASHAAMIVHRNWAFGTLSVLLIVAIWLIFSKKTWFKISYPFLSAIFLTFSLLVTTAWHGGELVYRYGLGVMSMPMMNKGKDNDNADSQNTIIELTIPKDTFSKPKITSSDGHDHEH